MGVDEVAAKSAAREAESKRAQRALLAAWGLATVSATHHAGHLLHLMVGRQCGLLHHSWSVGPSESVSVSLCKAG